MKKVAAVVLAAGGSSRMGSPKQLAMIGGETLLERAVRVAREAGCSPVVVVLGASYVQVLARSSLGDAVPVVNDRWMDGMAGSIRLGVGALKDAGKGADGALLMTCDQPAVTPEHLCGLMTGDEVRASRYAERNGVPAFFPARCFEDLTRLKGDAGARELLAAAEFQVLENGDLDVDTIDDLERARQMFGS